MAKIFLNGFVFGIVFALGVFGCGGEKPKVFASLNQTASLLGDLPANPLQWRVITSSASRIVSKATATKNKTCSGRRSKARSTRMSFDPASVCSAPRSLNAKGSTVTSTLNTLACYDPTTGEIRSSSTNDIACWFIDTDYNGESFFVRHAYFTGADEPYEKLKRALRAEIDEAAWSSLYSTRSRPFDPPKTGKVAVKVINHYGDEVLKVFDVG